MKLPSKIPAENYTGTGVNMLVSKINEVIEYLESTHVIAPVEVSIDCAHLDTYAFGRNKQLRKCKTCGKVIK